MIKFLLCKHQPQISHIVLQDVLDLSSVQVRVVTLKILKIQNLSKLEVYTL